MSDHARRLARVRLCVARCKQQHVDDPCAEMSDRANPLGEPLTPSQIERTLAPPVSERHPKVWAEPASLPIAPRGDNGTPAGEKCPVRLEIRSYSLKPGPDFLVNRFLVFRI